jgi:RNA polymerase sigma factor (sigma-70 family)
VCKCMGWDGTRLSVVDNRWVMLENPEAFATLFDRHQRAVYNYCFRRTGDWALAEDLTSAVFLEAWRRAARSDLQETTARAWLLGVATNLIRNQRRSLRRYRSALDRVPVKAGEPDFSDEIATRLDAAAQMRAVLGIVEQLPRKHQEVIALCIWMELTYQEAALALGVPVGTVRSRLSRARERLEALTTETRVTAPATRPADGRSWIA